MEPTADHGLPSAAPLHERPRRRWLWTLVVVGMAIGVLVCAVLLTRSMFPTYTGTATFYLAKERPHLLPHSPVGDDQKEDFETFRLKQVALIKSHVFLNRVLDDPKVSSLITGSGFANTFVEWMKWLFDEESPENDPIGWLAGQLEVDFPASPEMMRIRVRGKNAEQASVLVTAIRESYLKEVRHREEEARRVRIRQLQGLADELKDKLRSLRDERKGLLRASPEEAGLGATSLRREVLTEELLHCKRELLRVRLARAGPPKDAATDRVLAAQEQLLGEEEKQLLAKAERMEKGKSGDLQSLDSGIEALEDAMKRINMELQALDVEKDAPPRVQPWGDVFVRKSW
jgi:hypothetical protein